MRVPITGLLLTLLAVSANAQSGKRCDGATVNIIGKIEDVVIHQRDNSYTIATRIPGCDEIHIVGKGRPPAGCVKGRTVSATGRLEFMLYVFDMMDPTRLSCY